DGRELLLGPRLDKHFRRPAYLEVGIGRKRFVVLDDLGEIIECVLPCALSHERILPWALGHDKRAVGKASTRSRFLSHIKNRFPAVYTMTVHDQCQSNKCNSH